MFDTGHNLALRRTVRPELVSDHHAGRVPLAPQELSHQTLCGLGIAAALDQNVKDEAVPVDSAPKSVFLAGDRDDNLIKVPIIAAPAGRSLTDTIGEMPAGSLRPQPHGLVA